MSGRVRRGRFGALGPRLVPRRHDRDGNHDHHADGNPYPGAAHPSVEQWNSYLRVFLDLDDLGATDRTSLGSPGHGSAAVGTRALFVRLLDRCFRRCWRFLWHHGLGRRPLKRRPVKVGAAHWADAKVLVDARTAGRAAMAALLTIDHDLGDDNRRYRGRLSFVFGGSLQRLLANRADLGRSGDGRTTVRARALSLADKGSE